MEVHSLFPYESPVGMLEEGLESALWYKSTDRHYSQARSLVFMCSLTPFMPSHHLWTVMSFLSTLRPTSIGKEAGRCAESIWKRKIFANSDNRTPFLRSTSYPTRCTE